MLTAVDLKRKLSRNYTQCRRWMMVRGDTSAQPARDPSNGASIADVTHGDVSIHDACGQSGPLEIGRG